MGLTFVLWLKAMKLATNTSRIANLIFLSPFLSLALISTFVGEDIQRSTLAGLVLIMAGLGVQRLGTAKAARSKMCPTQWISRDKPKTQPFRRAWWGMGAARTHRTMNPLTENPGRCSPVRRP